MKEKYCILNKLIKNYKYIPPGSSSKFIDFESMDENNIEPGDYVTGKAWLSSLIYAWSPVSYTPFRPIFKGHVEAPGISGISWLLNYMPVIKTDLSLEKLKLAFLYPYKASGFNIKLSFQGIPIETYNQYMSLMFSKEEYPPDSFYLQDDDFKPFPVLIPIDMETENIVDFCGSISCFEVSSNEIISMLNKTAISNYSRFINENINPLCISISGNDTHIRAEKFKDFKNSRYNVKYGSIFKEFKLEGKPELPGFIPDIPHALCGKIGSINEEFKAPAFSSTPNYGIRKTKAISSFCGPVLFNYASGNIISLSVFFNLNDKIQQHKMEKSLLQFEIILKEQLIEYVKTNFKSDISFTEI